MEGEAVAHKKLSVAALRMNGGTQTRECIDADTVESYAAAMADGAEFPPVVAFYDGKYYWLADGFHRVAAEIKAGHEKVAVDVRQGDRRAAILFSVGANASHGLRRTNADKRRAVMVLLGDEEWRAKSARWIAEKCGVSDRFVDKMKSDATANGSQLPKETLGKDGKTRRHPERSPKPTPVNDTGDEEQDDPKEREVFEADEDDEPIIHPERQRDGWGDFEVSGHVAKIAQVCRDFGDRLDALFRQVDPRFENDVLKRCEDMILTAFEKAASHLPVDAKRAERNRARFQVISGGQS